MFEAGFRPDAYPVLLSAKTAKQRRFEENIEFLRDLSPPDLMVMPDLI
ncbi:hypothetical protein HYW73_00590 [Candidatus Nomurabacteria bacterium]|nr:hypothetical protein [Candidatus Nomurabacteria bacterium]